MFGDIVTVSSAVAIIKLLAGHVSVSHFDRQVEELRGLRGSLWARRMESLILSANIIRRYFAFVFHEEYSFN